MTGHVEILGPLVRRALRYAATLILMLVVGIIALAAIFFYGGAKRGPRELYNYSQFLPLRPGESPRTGELVIEAPGGEVCVVQDAWDLSSVVKSLGKPTYDEGVWYVVRRVEGREIPEWVASQDYLLDIGTSSFRCAAEKLTITLFRTDQLGYVARVED